MTTREGVIIDANVIIHGRGDLPFQNIITSQSVYKEIKSQISQFKLQSLDLQTFKPKKETLEKVSQEASKYNLAVSEEDCSLIALGIEKNLTVISDDKELQNLCKLMDVSFDSFLGDRIEETMKFGFFCENCGSNRKDGEDVCESCGSQSFVRKRVE